MTLGGKYVWKANENPGPGMYESESATALTKPRIRDAIIKEDSDY